MEERQPLRAGEAEQEVAEAEAGVAAVGEVQLAVQRAQVDVVTRSRGGTRRRTSSRGCPSATSGCRRTGRPASLELRPEERSADAREPRDRHVRQAAVEARIVRHAAGCRTARSRRCRTPGESRRSGRLLNDAAELVEDVRAEHARPAGHRALAAVQDVAGEVARRHRILEQRRLVAVGVLEAVAREDSDRPAPRL